ncbi:MAG: hypothetical protein NLN65_04940, partial [Candidatus Poseidoniaceae archaeon]|nr:hypothetical protein [Candidatus Poseidoniaceae archaeon]
NRVFSKTNRIASQWLKIFVYRSSTESLKAAVKNKYSKLPPSQQGGFTYLYLTLCEMFKMTREVKESMLVFLKLFKAKGLARYTGENVLVASTELTGICRRLSTADALTEEHVHGVLTGLGICGNNMFREMFRLLAQAADLGSVSTVMPNISFDATPLEQVEALLEKAVDLHEALVISGNWNTAAKGGGKFAGAFGDAGSGMSERTCWNCDKKGCNVRDCDQPKDQAKIDKNKTKYYKDLGKPVPTGKKPFKSKDKNDPGAARDTRKVWSAQNLTLVNNCLMANCKTCGHNSTHTTNFHNAWAANKNTFKLPATHPLVVEKTLRGEVTNEQTNQPAQPSGPPSSSTDIVKFNRMVMEEKIAELERNSCDPDGGAALTEQIRSLFLN